jgi:hypothetical protein
MFEDIETSLEDFLAEPTKQVKREQFPCQACGGTGKYAGVRIHQDRSDCFTCKGRGFFYTSYDDRKKARIQRLERKAQKAFENACNGERQIKGAIGDAGYQWLVAATWSSFYQDLLGKARKYGSLSEKQLACVVSGWAKQQVRDAERNAARDANAPVIDLTKINGLFDTAKGNGLKKPRLVCGSLRLSLAPLNGANAGCTYVKDQGEYAGKITAEGKFFAVRTARAEIAGELQEIAKDPLNAFKVHGQVTGSCSCCGRELTNKDSIALGIGPICADKWGLV